MCGFTGLTPPFSQSFGAAGGRATIQVTPSSGCSWTAVSEDPWIIVTSGWSGTGSGSLTYSVAPNLDSSPRSGTLRIGTASFSVDQSGGTPSTEGVLFVPIVLDVFGVAPSHYTSELTLTNRSDRDASLRLAYTGASTLGGGSGSAHAHASRRPSGHRARRDRVPQTARRVAPDLGESRRNAGRRGQRRDVALRRRRDSPDDDRRGERAGRPRLRRDPGVEDPHGHGLRLRPPRERDRPLEPGSPERRRPRGRERHAPRRPSSRAIRPLASSAPTRPSRPAASRR